MNESPKAYLLDALGTLVELLPPVEPLRRALRERFGLELSVEQVGAAMQQEIAWYRANHDIAADRARLAELRRGATVVLRDGLGQAGADLPLHELTAALLTTLRFQAYPEVPEVLKRARAGGIRLVVVSNWDVSLHDALETTGLAPLLDGVVISAEVGSAKPAGEIFARGLALAEVGAQEALHVGDDVTADVAGARAAGIDARLVVRDGESGGSIPDGVEAVTSLRELPGLPAA